MECTLECEKAAQHAEAAADELARALAFVGNSFLAPMSQTFDAALDRAFWAAFPDFGSEEAACALDGLFAWAAEGENAPRAERVRAVSVEYARLFIGPPEPAVAPWESFYVQEGVTNGFGEPTFRMRERLRQAALEVSNENTSTPIISVSSFSTAASLRGGRPRAALRGRKRRLCWNRSWRSTCSPGSGGLRRRSMRRGRPTTVCWPISPRVCLALCGPSRRAHQPVQPKEERFLAERLCLRAL